MTLILMIVISTAWAGVARATKGGLLDRLPQARTDRVLTGEDFLKGRVDRGSGNEVTFRVMIHPGMPPFKIRIIPNPAAAGVSGNSPQNAGRIEISKEGSATIDQTIDVRSFGDASMLLKYFTMEDVNFDGYLDIGTLYEFGAKWGAYQFLVYDAPSGRFIRNGLTKQLGAIKANERKLDPEHKEIHFSYLLVGEGRIGETYDVRKGGLILTLVEDRRKSGDGGFEIVTTRFHNGLKKVVGVRKESESNQ